MTTADYTDTTPLDAEWLKGEGWDGRIESEWYSLKKDAPGYHISLRKQGVREAECYIATYMDAVRIKAPTTRGALRLLVAGLGLEW